MRVSRTGSSRLRMTRGGVALEDLARDDQSLDLTRALVDLRDLCIAVVALDRKLLRVAVPAEDLDRFARLATCHLGSKQLRLRTFLCVRESVLLAPSCSVDEQPGGVDLRRHVGELPLNRLKVSDPLPERVSFARVLPSNVVGSLRDPERLRGDADPASVEGRHRNREALVLLVQQPVGTDLRAL